MKKNLAVVLASVMFIMSAFLVTGCSDDQPPAPVAAVQPASTPVVTPAIPVTQVDPGVGTATSNDLVVGKWEFYSMTANGTTMTKDQLAQAAQQSGSEDVLQYLPSVEFASDGTLVMTSVDSSMNSISLEGTYTVSGNTVSITTTTDGVTETETGTVSGTTLSLSDGNGTEIVFEKAY